MEVLFVDLGSYSIKFLRGFVRRHSLDYIDFNEVILQNLPTSPAPPDSNDKSPETPQDDDPRKEIKNQDDFPLSIIEEKQFEVIEDYLNSHQTIEKIIFKFTSLLFHLSIYQSPH